MTELPVKTEAHVKVVLEIKDIAVFVPWAAHGENGIGNTIATLA